MGDEKIERKLFRFAWEKLELRCEYGCCDFVDNSTLSFTGHISECHLAQLTDDDLHCHWKDCEAFAYSPQELRRHILLHAYHAKIKCYGKNLQVREKLPECTLGSQNRNLVPELPEPIVCCWDGCSVNFENPELFYSHVDMHSGGNSGERKPLKCLWLECKRTFTDSYKLKEHVKAHSQEKVIACPVCGTMFASRTKFADHVLRQVPVSGANPVETFACEYCPKKLLTERLLREHTRTHVCHYKCPLCSMSCPTPSMLRAHISYRHSNIKSHSCKYCDYKCKRKGDLRKHLETHSDVPPHSCPEEGCDYSTRSQTCMKHHTNSKHGPLERPKYQCHVCDKITTRGNYLTKHMLDKHNIRWPSGHSRFRYHLDTDGFYRLQTVRYESADLSVACVLDEGNDRRNPDDPSKYSQVGVADTSNAPIPNDENVKISSQSHQLEVVSTASSSSTDNAPLTLYVHNDNGEVSEYTVALQGTISNVVLVTPDGKECDPMTLWL